MHNIFLLKFLKISTFIAVETLIHHLSFNHGIKFLKQVFDAY